MRTLALNGCMWYIVSLTGFRVDPNPNPKHFELNTSILSNCPGDNQKIAKLFVTFGIFNVVLL